jgi:hypothetical protein
VKHLVPLLAVPVFAACAAADPPVVVPAAATVTAPALASAPASAPANASASASVPAPAPAPAPSTFSAWTDPGGVDALASDCHAASDAAPSESPDPLACRLPFDQSCVYDPCFSRNQECRGECSRTCTSCDTACGGTCDTCKAGCKDDACRRDCAARAGACKQACLATLDHCSTGTCGQASVRACEKAEKAKWIAHKCSCRTAGACAEQCIHSSDDKAREACFAGCRARFPGCDLGYCLMGEEPTKEYPP